MRCSMVRLILGRNEILWDKVKVVNFFDRLSFFLNESHYICLNSWKTKDKLNLNAEMEDCTLPEEKSPWGRHSCVMKPGYRNWLCLHFLSWRYMETKLWQQILGRSLGLLLVTMWKDLKAWGGNGFCIVVNKELSVVIEQIRNKVQFVLWRQYWRPSDN